MRLLVASSLWPHPSHTVRAANIVIHEMLSALTRQPDLKTGLVVIGGNQALEVTTEAKRAGDDLKSQGLELLEPVLLMPDSQSRSKWARLTNPRFTDHYPAAAQAAIVEKAIRQFSPDVMLIPWSEWLTALCSRIDLPKFAYYGNPDPKNARVRLELGRQIGQVGLVRGRYLAQRINELERFHLAAMEQYQWLGNVAANDANYYSMHGHPNAFYVRNMWMESQYIHKESRPGGEICRILANVGRVDGTANTLGLEYLGQEMLPALRNTFGARQFELHILGSGTPLPHVMNLLGGREVKWRGFVDDIDREIATSDVFLCVNNATRYKVGHTRYLHAWSLGATVVAHRDASLSMPEILDEENALLGGSAPELAENVLRVFLDRDVKTRIGAAGYKSFRSLFTATSVVPTILQRIAGQRP